MGKRARQDPDLPLKQFRAQIILAAAFTIGGIAGVLFLCWMGQEEYISLCDYLIDYLSLVRDQSLHGSFWGLFWDCIRMYALILLLRSVFWGIFGIPVLCFEQGFFLAFGTACFWKVFGAVGLFPAFALFGIPAMFWGPVLFLIGTTGFMNLLSSGDKHFDPVFLRRSFFCLVMLICCAASEYWVVPVLLRSAAALLF